MIKTNKIPDDILQRIPKACAYLQSRPDVKFSYLFGGLAKNKKKPLSDVDIAVYLSNLNESSHKKLEILGKLNDLLGTDEIDLVLLNDASLPLIINILKNN